jgi:two-component system phosphate regulon response regulator PhoB
MTQKHILIVDDEASIREMLKFSLNLAGFSVDEAERVSIAEQLIANRLPDLILLDWMLPGVTGIEFARRLKREKLTKEIPIIMLTARAEEDNKVKGLETGADDYIVKPFSPKELVARINAVLRRGVGNVNDVIQIQGLRIDTGNHDVSIDGRAIKLRPMEYQLLHFFVTHSNRVYSREQLLTAVWGGNTDVDDRTVDAQIKRLRQSFRDQHYANLIETVRGTGYRFVKK